MHVLHSHAPLPAKPRLRIVLNVGSTPAAGFGDCGRLCPVWALLSYVAGRPDATPLTKTHFVGAVRLALRQAGLEPRVYAGYSFSHWHCHYGGGGWPGGLIHPVPGLLVQRSFFGIYPDDPRATLHHFANSGPHSWELVREVSVDTAVEYVASLMISNYLRICQILSHLKALGHNIRADCLL